MIQHVQCITSYYNELTAVIFLIRLHFSYQCCQCCLTAKHVPDNSNGSRCKELKTRPYWRCQRVLPVISVGKNASINQWCSLIGLGAKVCFRSCLTWTDCQNEPKTLYVSHFWYRCNIAVSSTGPNLDPACPQFGPTTPPGELPPNNAKHHVRKWWSGWCYDWGYLAWKWCNDWWDV